MYQPYDSKTSTNQVEFQLEEVTIRFKASNHTSIYMV